MPGLVNGSFQLLLFSVLFITLFCLAWESTGFEPRLLFGPCIAALPLSGESFHGDSSSYTFLLSSGSHFGGECRTAPPASPGWIFPALLQ